MARLSEGAKQPPRCGESVDLVELAEECESILSIHSASQGVSLRLDASNAAQGAHADVDRTVFRQILLNLLTNAIKYNRPGGEVNVTVHKASNIVRVIVADTGYGIASARLAHVGEKYNRLDFADSEIPGTGLGLSIAREMVVKLGGSLLISSTEGVGTTVAITLPLAEVETSTAICSRPESTMA